MDEHNQNSGTSSSVTFKLDAEVGIHNKAGKLLHLGRFQGVFLDENHQNKDYALIRLRRYTGSWEVYPEIVRLVEELKLEKITQSLVVVPIKDLRIFEKEKKNVKHHRAT